MLAALTCLCACRWLFVYCFGAVKAIKHLGLEDDCYTIGSSGAAPCVLHRCLQAAAAVVAL